jgi:3-oxoacyl-[acyl-carrier protein] reductase
VGEFTGKNVLITGASSGIGWHTARMFAEAGASVLAHYHRNAEGAAKLGVPMVAADLAVSIDPLRAAVDQHLGGRVDVLVNNAGSLIERRRILEMDEALWDRVFNLNLKSAFRCCRAFMPGMVERGQGAVINVTSIAGRNGGGPGAAAYAAAKGGMITFTKGLAKEVAASGVRVNAVAPGVIQTPFHEQFSTPAMMEAFVKNIPLGRAGTPEEVAGVILFLASARAAYLVGETIEVNGGLLLD